MLSKADLHVHTQHSFDAVSSPEQIVEASRVRGLSVIAITDHDTVAGAKEARAYVENERIKDIEVVVGEEINTGEGEILGLYLEDTIPAGLGILESIEAVRAQGGLIIVPHPFFWMTLKQTITVRRFRKIFDKVDAIEVLNSSTAGKMARTKRLRVNRTIFKLPEVGSSDAHHFRYVGSAYTTFKGRTAEDLRKAIEEGSTEPHGSHTRRMDDLFLAKEVVKKQFKKQTTRFWDYLVP